MNTLEGKLLAEGQRIGIVAARFNEFITSKLLGGAVDAFVRHGGDESKIDVDVSYPHLTLPTILRV